MDPPMPSPPHIADESCRYSIGTVEHVFTGISCACYVGLVFFSIFIIIHSRMFCMRKKWGQSEWMRLAIIATFSLVCIVRIPNDILNVYGPHEDYALTKFVLNRLSLSLHYTAFIGLSLQWMTVANSIRLGRKVDPVIFRNVCIAVFVVLSLFIWVYNIVLLAYPNRFGEGTPAFDVNSYILASLALVLSIVFLGYGIYLYVVIKKIQEHVGSNSKKAKNIMLIMGIFFVSFLMRSIALFYRLWTNCYLPYWLFWTLSYTVPFVLPFSIQLYFFFKKTSTIRSVTLIADREPSIGR